MSVRNHSRNFLSHPRITVGTWTIVRIVLVLFAGIPWAVMATACSRYMVAFIRIRTHTKDETHTSVTNAWILRLVFELGVASALTVLTVLAFLYANVSLLQILLR